MAVELALGLKGRIAPLAKDFITADGNGVREVQRPCLVDHRDADAAVGIAHEDVLGYAAGLFAEDDLGSGGIGDLAVLLPCLGGEEEILAAGGLLEEVVDRVIVGDVDEVPVVETGAFQIAVGDLEAEGLHQMQTRACGGAGAGDIAGVLRDLRLKKNDVQCLMIRIKRFQILSPLFHCRAGRIILQEKLLKEVENMDKMCKEKKKGTFGSILVGMAAGAAVGVVGKMVFDSNKRMLKKKADEMLSAMSDLGETAMDFFK